MSVVLELPRLAIIGAGFSGLILARELDGHADVTVFEKSSRVGGRIATCDGEGFQFDYGAQFMTARSRAFKGYLKPLITAGHVNEWHPRTTTLGDDRKSYGRDWYEPHYIAVPSMNMLCQLVASGLNIMVNTEVQLLKRISAGWLLRDSNNTYHGPFEWVVCAIPAPQAAGLLPASFVSYEKVAHTTMLSCYSLLLGFSRVPKIPWQAAVVKNSPIGWLAWQPSRPGRDNRAGLLLHSTNNWAEQHRNASPTCVQQILWCELERLMAKTMPELEYSRLHLWHYANIEISEEVSSDNEDCLIDHQLRLGVCGDWLMGGRVESAYLSGLALAKELKQWL